MGKGYTHESHEQWSPANNDDSTVYYTHFHMYMHIDKKKFGGGGWGGPEVQPKAEVPGLCY